MYIVMTASAAMHPSSVRSPYRRVAVVEVKDGFPPPRMITDRSRSVVRIVRTWERLNVGKGVRSAYAKALAEANTLCDDLNGRNAA